MSKLSKEKKLEILSLLSERLIPLARESITSGDYPPYLPYLLNNLETWQQRMFWQLSHEDY